MFCRSAWLCLRRGPVMLKPMVRQMGSLQEFCSTLVNPSHGIGDALVGHGSRRLQVPVHASFPLTKRGYASKDVKKEKKGSKVIELSVEEMEEIVSFQEFQESLRNLVQEFRDQLSKQFSLRTSSASFESVLVDLKDKQYLLNEIAQIAFKTPQMIMINLSATPAYLQPVLKSLGESGLNLNPQVEGHMIYIPVPKVSREHRETLSKNAKASCNKFKERLRRIQNTHVSNAKTKTDKPADLVRNVVQKLMEKVDACGKELDSLLQAKQKELLNQEN